MDIKEIIDAVEIEGASGGDVVFISTSPEMSATDFSKFAEAFRSHANATREAGEFFPRCFIMPPGVTVDIARAQTQDQIEITSDALTLACDIGVLSPDAGFPHG
jgi:hypothetical protein